jgi:glycosyltransferase involved in cell wall biosynthesis
MHFIVSVDGLKINSFAVANEFPKLIFLKIIVVRNFLLPIIQHIRKNNLFMTPISVVIITFNEEANIERCIQSVRSIADEVIVLDSGSTDATVAIAEQNGAKVFHQPFLGYIAQTNKARTFAKHVYVLSLDADEQLDETLQKSILAVKNNLAVYQGYKMNRLNSYCGQFIKHGLWYPDQKIRLYDGSKAQWKGNEPHPYIELDNRQSILHLKGDILHYSYDHFEEHVLQNNKFSTLTANYLFKEGKRTSGLKIFINPLWAFVNSYFLRLGFLDGFNGYVIAKQIAHLTFMKHVKLYNLQKEKTKS